MRLQPDAVHACVVDKQILDRLVALFLDMEMHKLLELLVLFLLDRNLFQPPVFTALDHKLLVTT